jgi:LPXTG-site transpeptidase (sortase) family protein
MTSVRKILDAQKRALTLAAFLLAIVALPLAIACTSKPKSSGPTFGSLSGITAVPGSSATAGGTSSPPDDAAVTQFLLPKFSVSGNVVVKGVDPKTNEMLSPDNKDDVAYYDFSGHPGYGCPSAGKCANAVFSGHVDWYTKEVGVFWHLKDLSEGDEIDLKLADGALFKYKVVANTIYKSSEAPVQEILGDTPQESVTLITCDGVFDKQLQEYNSRRIVRAVREA